MSRWWTPRACRTASERLALLYYGALGSPESEALVRHLRSCPACALEWEGMRRTLDAMHPGTVFPGEAEVDWSLFARRTVARALAAEAETGRTSPGLAGPPRGWQGILSPAVRWGTLAGMLLLVGWGVALRLRPGAPVSEPPGAGGASSGEAPPLASLLESAHVIEKRLARQGAARYLSDGRALLVNFVGATAPCLRGQGRFDIALEREKSRQLLRRKNLYESDLLTLQDRRLATLVGQLESVLIQVAALEDCASARQIRDLREQIEMRQILLRIDLVTRELAGRSDVV